MQGQNKDYNYQKIAKDFRNCGFLCLKYPCILSFGTYLALLNSPKPHLLLSLHSSFTPNLKQGSSENPILIHPHHPTILPVSTPNAIHHSYLLSACPTFWILTPCLSILFWISTCE